MQCICYVSSSHAVHLLCEKFEIRHLLCQQFCSSFCYVTICYHIWQVWPISLHRVHPKMAGARFAIFPKWGVMLCQQFDVYDLLC